MENPITTETLSRSILGFSLRNFILDCVYYRLHSSEDDYMKLFMTANSLVKEISEKSLGIIGVTLTENVSSSQEATYILSSEDWGASWLKLLEAINNGKRLGFETSEDFVQATLSSILMSSVSFENAVIKHLCCLQFHPDIRSSKSLEKQFHGKFFEIRNNPK